MIVIPAIDLRGGRCVQLRGGKPEDEQVSLPDPVAVAARWWEAGFAHLHIVDLDAALGDGDNRELIGEITDATPAETQVGGGVRSSDTVDALLEAGADRIIVGTRAVDDPTWLSALSRAHPDRVVLAADVRDGKVLRKGWTESTELTAAELFSSTADLPLAGVLCTDVAREGRLEGIAPWTVRPLIQRSPHPIWMSGGVTTLDEIRTLQNWGAAGAILGMALYTETLDPSTVARKWGS
jgi:phosphoribosylformimino-5-aminoimidazole carboxamide ribotide isomerase